MLVAFSSILMNGTSTGIPLAEDPVSEGSAVPGPGRLFQSCNACKATSLTGFTYLGSNMNQIKHLQNKVSSIMDCLIDRLPCQTDMLPESGYKTGDMNQGKLHHKKQYLLVLCRQLYVLSSHCSSATPECLSMQLLMKHETEHHQPKT